MVQLRLAEWDDLPTLAKLAADAFQTDPIYLHFNPWRSIYPEDWERSFLHTLQWRYAEAGSVVLVAELQDESPNKTIVGYLTATRRGPDAQPVSSWMQNPTEWGHQIATPAQQAEGKEFFRNC
jgi:RimJ/RimL family protein N-acetyltransferase